MILKIHRVPWKLFFDTKFVLPILPRYLIRFEFFPGVLYCKCKNFLISAVISTFSEFPDLSLNWGLFFSSSLFFTKCVMNQLGKRCELNFNLKTFIVRNLFVRHLWTLFSPKFKVGCDIIFFFLMSFFREPQTFWKLENLLKVASDHFISVFYLIIFFSC